MGPEGFRFNRISVLRHGHPYTDADDIGTIEKPGGCIHPAPLTRRIVRQGREPPFGASTSGILLPEFTQFADVDLFDRGVAETALRDVCECHVSRCSNRNQIASRKEITVKADGTREALIVLDDIQKRFCSLVSL